MADSPIFLVGCDRSGTTLLRLMLIQNPELHIPEESNFLTILDKHQESYGDFTQPHQRWFFIRDLQTNKATPETFTFPIFNLSPEEADEALRAAAPTNFFAAAAVLFGASAQKNRKNRWGDKTPCHVLEIARLAAAFPKAQFVHIIRDGRDVAASILEAGWTDNMPETAHFWKKRVEAGRFGLALGKNRYREIKYEDLVMRPEDTLRRLCEWLNLKYTPRMLRYYENAGEHIAPQHAHLHELLSHPPEPERVQAWKHTLSRRNVADFESVAGNLLKELDYEVSGATIPIFVRSTRFLIQRATPLLKWIATLIRSLGVNFGRKNFNL